MNKKNQINTLKFFEWSFYVGSLAWTLLTFLTFVMAYSADLDPKLFSMTSNFYWWTVLLYAATRKVVSHRLPDQRTRKSEFILIFWMIVGLAYGAVTVFLKREQLPLMQELLWMYGILIGILLGGKALEQALGSIFKRD